MNFIKEQFGLSGYNQWEILWGPEQPVWIFVLLGLFVPAALWFFWTSLARIRSWPKRGFLFGLRLLAFTLLILLLLQPKLQFHQSETQKNSIAVLLDNSKSMSIQTLPAEEPRIEAVRKTLAANRSHLDALKTDFNVDHYLISDRVEAWPEAADFAGYHPRAANTDFSRVLAELKKQYQEKSLKGLLLFSDGADLTQAEEAISRELMQALAAFDAPIHTFQAGSNEGFKDLAIDALDAADFGFVHQPIRVAVTLSASSMGNKNVPLILKEGNNILVSKVVEIREGQRDTRVEMEFTPKELGKRVYSVSVPLFAGESIPSNNRRNFQVNVIRDRIRVLHLNGRPSWDSRFLREVLVNNPKVDLLSFFILRTLGDDVAAPTSELSLIPFPSNLLFSDYLNSFDLILFQNFRFESFIDKKLLSNLKAYVQDGGSFMMIGGELSFAGGGYKRTPIEDILPVNLKDNSPMYLYEDFRPQLSGDLIQHPILRLEKDAAANKKIWKSLPVLNGVNLGLVPKPGSHVLASYSKPGPSPVSHPLLVTQRMGKGRSLILATDSSWNWNFLRVGEGGSGRYYQRLWNNLLAWLTGDSETQLLQLETDRERYREEERVFVKFRVLNENYRPAANHPVRLTLTSVTGESKTHELATDDNGDGGFQYIPMQEGFYTVKVETKVEGRTLNRQIQFGVFAETAEFDRPRVNGWLLEKIAAVTGGVHTVLDSETDLSSLKFENPMFRVKTRSKTLTLWDNWWSYGLILSCLLLDWWIRRKSGLS